MTGAYKIESSNVSFLTKGMVLFILPKKIKITLKIRPIFKAPKRPPNPLFKKPKAAKSANLVNNFPASAMTTIIITKVPAKAAKEIYSSLQETLSFK